MTFLRSAQTLVPLPFFVFHRKYCQNSRQKRKHKLPVNPADSKLYRNLRGEADGLKTRIAALELGERRLGSVGAVTPGIHAETARSDRLLAGVSLIGHVQGAFRSLLALGSGVVDGRDRVGAAGVQIGR